MEIDARDKIAIVAGGARGIGAATAERLVDSGSRVLVCDVNEELGAELADRLGERAAFLPTDVRDPAQCRRAVDEAWGRFGGLDWLVSCAIVMDPAPLAELAPESWRRVLDVGLTGSFLISQAFGQRLIAEGRPGAIVHLSSNAGLEPYGGSGAYSTVKAGILMLSDQLGLEWAPHGIRVNAVCPGHVQTPLTAYLQDPEIKRGREEVTPLGRVGQPEDVAAAAVFLLSDAASYMTSSHVVVDGGVSRSIYNHLPGRRWD